MKILTICNYGLVRSVCMARTLLAKGHESMAVGLMREPPWVVDKLIEVSDLAIICNKPNIENRLQPDIPMEYVDAALKPLEKHKEKIITCDTIGLDKWGDPSHSDLITLCAVFVSKKEQEGILTLRRG